MLGLFVWWAGIFLEAAILLRAIRCRIFAKYAYFYTYVSCILLVDLTRFFIFKYEAPAFRNWYWSTEFLSVAIGYGVILEILRQALAHYRGPARFGSRILWASFFAVLAYVAFKSATVTNWSAPATGAELERDLRAVQAFVLAGILILISHYRIEIGKNLKGMIVGYGAFIACSVLNLAVQAYADPPVRQFSRGVQSYSFFIPLFVWVITLWSFHPVPAVQRNERLESDYETLARRTKGMLRDVRGIISGKPRK
jgi:hypothetical protein